MSDRGASSDQPGPVFNDLRLEGHFCDAVIKVEDVEFPIHKIILCQCSLYFRALFIRWSGPDKTVYNIPGLSPDMMQIIIKFAYTGSLSVTEDNVQELLLAADQFNIKDIVRACCDFLGEQLCPENCIGIWQFTFCSCFELQRKAYQFILDHFEEVVSSEEFQDLTVQELTDILERDDLNVSEETTVCEAILRWIAHRPEERQAHLLVLLSKVRLALMSQDHLGTTVISNELVKSNAECFQMVKEIMDNKDRLTLPAVFMRDPVARPRMPNTILLAIGGWSRAGPINSIEAYNIRADLWINLTNNQEPLHAYHGAAFLDGYVYCVGGYGSEEHLNSVRRLDLSTHTWQEVAPMHFRRCYVCTTVLDGRIYAMGGYNGYVRLRTAECYRPDTNQWSAIAPMHEGRSDASCTTFNNKIYICGGFTGNECLETCEYYSPETNQWTVIAPMNSQRSGVGVVACADRIFAVGGFDGSARLRSAEAYNPHTNTWHEVSSMSTTRSNFGIAVIEDLLFVVGGFNGFTTSNNVEYYNVMTDEWSEACGMEIYRSGVSCCVLRGLPNMAEYILSRDARPDSEVELLEEEST
ncbi:kelch-like protein 10 isoform X1 [Sparus aurata]|uniref:Kelch like family member 10 n=1 Tax=Sparus aurata TaxID=8175 RepID=A0A671V5G7_SPAAU|nr:kelch-like protein 10 isoform X1 [Sparus aurata]